MLSPKRYTRLAIADRIVAKRIFVSEVTQIGRGEKRTRAFLFNAWDRRRKQAKKKAVELAKGLKDHKLIHSEISKIMEKWKSDILPVFISEFEIAYRLGRNVGYKKATKQIKGNLQYGLPKEEKVTKSKKIELLPSFDLVDKENLKALTRYQTFWIGDFYKRGVSGSIASMTKQVMAEAGGGSEIAGRLMAKKIDESFKHVRLPKGFIGTPKQYFSGLTANAFTVARVHGQMRSFAEIGITRYSISNPGDKRTCSRCAHMDGKTFTTRQGVDQMHTELAANSKQAVKDAHPWLSLNQLRAISPVAGNIPGAAGVRDSQALSEHGQALPPYHFKCRCTVDVATESLTYNNLIPLTPPTVKKPSRVIETKPPNRVTSINDHVTKMLLTSSVQKEDLIKVAGMRSSYLTMRTHDNKTVTALWKKSKDKNYHKAETSFYQIDREIGGNMVVQPTVSRDPGLGSGVGVLNHYKKEWLETKKITEQQKKRIRLLDFISGNSSRRKSSILRMSSKKISVVDNGDSFKKSTPKKYFFPTKDKIQSANRGDISRLKEIGPKRIAQILEQNGIPEKAARLVLLRVSAVVHNPDLLAEKSTVKIWSTIETKPGLYVKDKDIKEIDRILKNVY